MSKLITLTFTENELEIVLNSLEYAAQGSVNKLEFKEDITVEEKQNAVTKLENLRVLQGSVITQKRIALGTISENTEVPEMPVNNSSSPE